MSWSEVYKINSNMKRSLNKQLNDLKFQEIKIITSSGTYTPAKTGLYKVICVGAGGNGSYRAELSSSTVGAGGGGGVAISNLSLFSNRSYAVTINREATFVYNSEITLNATGGSHSINGQVGAGGTASGGDNNYTGTAGEKLELKNVVPQAGGVSVYISELSQTPPPIFGSLESKESDGGIYVFSLNYGECLLGFGGGGTATSCLRSNASESYNKTSSSGRPAAVIIVPLELEE